jgi:hypothetical protein
LWRMSPWVLSGTSLLLGALTGADALLGLLALSSPRQALPEPSPNVLPLPTIRPRSRLPLSTILGFCQLALQLLDALALWLIVGPQAREVEAPGPQSLKPPASPSSRICC